MPQFTRRSKTTPLRRRRPTPHRETIFISYAREDRFWLERLVRHLEELETELRSENSQARIEVWADLAMAPGMQWPQEITRRLKSARAAILLLSPYFFHSQYIQEQELPVLLGAVRRGLARLIPIYVSPCAIPEPWSILASLQGANTPDRTLADMNDRDEQEQVFARAANQIRQNFGLPQRPSRPSRSESPESNPPREAVGVADPEIHLHLIRHREYTRLWRLTQILPKWPRANDVTYERLLQFSKDLQNWYFAGGGMYLSASAMGTYRKLQDELIKRVTPRIRSDSVGTSKGQRQTPGLGRNDVTAADYDAVRQRCSQLRTELTRDLESRTRPVLPRRRQAK